MEYAWIALLWIAYCWLHSYLISIRVMNFMTRLLKKYYAFYRLAYVILSIVLLIPVFRWTDRLNDPVIVDYPYSLNLVRIALSVGSYLIFFWAFFFDYDCLSFFGFRQISHLFKRNKPNGSGELKKSGLLGITRHPMYFALIVCLWSQTFTLCDIVLHVVLTGYVIIGTKLEENKLVLEFGDRYVQYQREVPMLVPFLKIREGRLAWVRYREPSGVAKAGYAA